MKQILCAAMIATSFLTIPTAASPSKAETNLCAYYGSVGSTVFEFMLPLKLQDLIYMIRGQRPELMAGLQERLLAVVDPAALGEAAKLKKADLELLSKAAGGQAFALAMSGIVATPTEAYVSLETSCRKNGSSMIIQQQRLADDAGKAMH
jgi:hypothetical protein